jgi:hypothetical protein
MAFLSRFLGRLGSSPVSCPLGRLGLGGFPGPSRYRVAGTIDESGLAAYNDNPFSVHYRGAKR